MLCGLYCDELVSEILGSNEMTECSPVRDGRTPNLVESRVIWQCLLEYWRLEWQKTVKRHPDK
jgi:hypothetical protein